MKVDKDVGRTAYGPLPFAFRLPFRRPQRPRFTITVNFFTLFEDSWEMEGGWNLPKAGV